MSKHKKTREQKIIADLRRKLSLQAGQAETAKQSTTPFSYSYSSSETITKPSAIIYTHEFLYRDLFKTAFLTLSIVVFEMLLFLLLKNNILRLPFGGF